ncbi:MAG: adenylyltransferase/cytidyltransferase family protein [Acidimicrobiales bacterium]
MDSGGRSVVTIGAYDGVHIGHRLVIERVRALASAGDLRSVVVTFDRHPASVVRPDSAPQLLTDLTQKLELLASTGIDEIELIHFDEERATETAEDFIASVLVSQLAVSVVVVGRNFHFGKARSGNVALLEEMGTEFGYEVVPFDLVMDETAGAGTPAEVISSTRIRRLIAAGDLAGAERLLRRPHEVRGVLSADGGRGRRAVEVPSDILLPPSGRYAARVASLQHREEWHSCEAHLEEDPATARAAVVTVTGESMPRADGDTVRLVFDRPA